MVGGLELWEFSAQILCKVSSNQHIVCRKLVWEKLTWRCALTDLACSGILTSKMNDLSPIRL